MITDSSKAAASVNCQLSAVSLPKAVLPHDKNTDSGIRVSHYCRPQRNRRQCLVIRRLLSGAALNRSSGMRAHADDRVLVSVFLSFFVVLHRTIHGSLAVREGEENLHVHPVALHPLRPVPRGLRIGANGVER